MTNCNPCRTGVDHHTIIFPNNGETFTHTFEVKDRPVIIKAINLPCSVEGRVEMGVFEACATWIWGPYQPECGQVMITGCTNILAIGIPGFYRIVFDAEDVGDLDDVILQQSTADVNQQILQLYGGTTMACGSQVTVTTDPNTGCTTIVVDGVPSTICPGSDVSITETATAYTLIIDGIPTTINKAQNIQCTAGGIMIDGELCPFPDGVDVSLNANPDGTHTLIVDGQPVIIYGAPPAAIAETTVVNNGDGTFTASNPGWPAPVTWIGTDTDSVTTASYNPVTGILTINNPSGPAVTVPIGGTSSVVYDPVTQTYTATNPDGSTVSWQDENSVTIVDFDAITNTVTVTNPDGSTLSFLAGVDSPARSEFDPHYGNDGTTVLFYAPTSI